MARKKPVICKKCGHPKDVHILVNYTDGISVTEGGMVCPTSLFED